MPILLCVIYGCKQEEPGEGPYQATSACDKCDKLICDGHTRSSTHIGKYVLCTVCFSTLEEILIDSAKRWISMRMEMCNR